MRVVRQDACPSVRETALHRYCERCGGWLFIEPTPLADGAIELGCIACGGRQYVTVARQVVGRRRPRRRAHRESQAS